MDPQTSDPVIDMMEEQKKIKMMGGTYAAWRLSM
jgi:CTP synthase (UTP-ammonia lyase)